MNLKDWIECGYSEEDAKKLLIEYKDAIKYENRAHLSYYKNTN